MLTIWLTFLPFSLWDTCGWWTLPVSVMVSFLLLGEWDTVHIGGLLLAAG